MESPKECVCELVYSIRIRVSIHPKCCRFPADPPQPMYVNMHELATMAATKAQEMNFPPPPPELITIPAENQEKVSDLKPDNK